LHGNIIVKCIILLAMTSGPRGGIRSSNTSRPPVT